MRDAAGGEQNQLHRGFGENYHFFVPLLKTKYMVAISKKVAPKPPKKISWETFQKRYLTKENGYKYEWLDGIVEKTPYAMNKNQFYILQNILDFFYSLKIKSKFKGSLIPEGDTFFGKHHRRPDIAYYTQQQIKDASNDLDAIPLFVIEVISTSDQMNKVHHKMNDYRNAGVSIVWHIFPELKEVHVYTKKATQMKIIKGKNLCSAEPVIKGFKISVDDIFKQ